MAHRDYYSRASIQISVFKNRIEVSNPGGLPSELNLEDLRETHSSYPRNPLLAGCMFLTGDIERYGTGILEIYRLSEKNGLVPPAISLQGGFKVTVYRPTFETEHVTEHVRRLLSVISGDMDRQQLMDALELKHRMNFMNIYVKPALEAELIEMSIPDKPKSVNQKYRLTLKGAALKKSK